MRSIGYETTIEIIYRTSLNIRGLNFEITDRFTREQKNYKITKEKIIKHLYNYIDAVILFENDKELGFYRFNSNSLQNIDIIKLTDDELNFIRSFEDSQIEEPDNIKKVIDKLIAPYIEI